MKHLIEASGIPHPEVWLVTVNGTPAGLGYRVKTQDQIEVFPYPSNQPGAPGLLPAEGARFILDIHLGKLATYLRILGFDCLYRNDYQDPELAQTSAETNRILLTRDRRLLMRKAVTYGYCLRSLDPSRQLVYVLGHYGLAPEVQPFRRCLQCNSPLQPVSEDQISDRLKPLTRQYYHEFHWCPHCDQVFWKGSHYEHMLQNIQRWLSK